MDFGKCGLCNERITSEEYMDNDTDRHNGVIYHTSCARKQFTECCECNCAIYPDEKVIEYDDEIYHRNCFFKEPFYCGRCFKCLDHVVTKDCGKGYPKSITDADGNNDIVHEDCWKEVPYNICCHYCKDNLLLKCYYWSDCKTMLRYCRCCMGTQSEYCDWCN